MTNYRSNFSVERMAGPARLCKLESCGGASTLTFAFADMNALRRRPSFVLRLMAVSLASALLFTGCQRKKTVFEQQREVIVRSEALCQKYLKGDLEHARQSLKANAELLEGATILEPVGRSQLLAKSYYRACVLEKRAGNETNAEVNLIKAKYWKVRNAELMGYSASEIMESINRDTPEGVCQYIDGFDRRLNDGNTAKYVQMLDRSGELDGAAKRSQTIAPQTNRTSAEAGPGR